MLYNLINRMLSIAATLPGETERISGASLLVNKSIQDFEPELKLIDRRALLGRYNTACWIVLSIFQGMDCMGCYQF